MKVERSEYNRLNIDWARAEHLFSCWCSGKEVAADLGVSYATFKNALRECRGMTVTQAKQTFRAKGGATIKEAQFQLVSQLDKTMIIFLSKALLGYRDNDQQQGQTPNIVIQTAGGETYDFSKFQGSEEEPDEDE